MERAVAGLDAEEREEAARLLKKLGLSAQAMLAERKIRGGTISE